MKIPFNWHGFLESTANKTAKKKKYYSEHITEFGGQYLSNEQCIYTSGGLGNEAIMVTSASMHKVEQLQPNQLYGTICMPHLMKINCCIHP